MTAAMFNATHERRIAEQAQRYAVLNGGLPWFGKGSGKVHGKSPGRPGLRCVGPDGTIYPSCEAAGRAVGLKQRSVQYRCDLQMDGWRYAE